MTAGTLEATVQAPAAGGRDTPRGPVGREPRIPSLDGVRAVAVAMVCLAHLGGSPGFPFAEAQTQFFDLGNLGVRTFFVLSGFLITNLLIGEWSERGTISLPRFYFRRTFRIFPAYYAYLGVVALAASRGLIALWPGDLRHALTYTQNYHLANSLYVWHAWSLSVEEQFYLLWPAVLLAWRPRWGLRLAAMLVCMAPLVRLTEWHFLPDIQVGIRYRSETVADAIAVGCLLAGWRTQLWARNWYRALLASRWFALVPIGVLGISAVPGLGFQYLVGISLMTLGIAATLDWCVRTPTGLAGRVLNAAPMRTAGVLSYSLYLWQQPFLDRHGAFWWNRFPTSLLLTVGVAAISYVLVERPVLALRARIERRLAGGGRVASRLERVAVRS